MCPVNDSKYLTAGEVATRLDVSRMTVNRWIKAGKLPAFRLGSVLRIPTEAVDQFEADHSTGGDAA